MCWVTLTFIIFESASCEFNRNILYCFDGKCCLLEMHYWYIKGTQPMWHQRNFGQDSDWLGTNYYLQLWDNEELRHAKPERIRFTIRWMTDWNSPEDILFPLPELCLSFLRGVDRFSVALATGALCVFLPVVRHLTRSKIWKLCLALISEMWIFECHLDFLLQTFHP